METIVEDAVTIEGSDKVALQCSIREYHIVIFSNTTK